jgi:hypothetical protein
VEQKNEPDAATYEVKSKKNRTGSLFPPEIVFMKSSIKDEI